MTRYRKHIGLLIGIVLAFVSFLFFGRKQGTYLILLMSGCGSAFVFCLSILLGKGSLKGKLIWMAIVIFFVCTQRLAEPFLIDQSYRIFISENASVLGEINSILMQKQGSIDILGDSVFCTGEQLSAYETTRLKEGREKLGVYLISTFDKGVYYGLWGFLKVRLGISYLPGGGEPQKQFRHLTGNWFR